MHKQKTSTPTRHMPHGTLMDIVHSITPNNPKTGKKMYTKTVHELECGCGVIRALDGPNDHRKTMRCLWHQQEKQKEEERNRVELQEKRAAKKAEVEQAKEERLKKRTAKAKRSAQAKQQMLELAEMVENSSKQKDKDIATYSACLSKFSVYGDTRIIDALVQSTEINTKTLLDLDRLDDLVERMHLYLEARFPEVLPQLKVFRKDDPEHQAKKLVFRTEVNGSPRETVLDHSFLSSPEYRELLAFRKTFNIEPPVTNTNTLNINNSEVLTNRLVKTFETICGTLADINQRLTQLENAPKQERLPFFESPSSLTNANGVAKT